jgi:hypothetical protein
MRNVKLDSEKNSGAMYPIRRQLRRPRKGERNFLADQAADAKTAMSQTLLDMKETLMRVADLRLIAQQHPWLVTGSAVVVGFVTGAVLTHSPQKKIKKTRANSDAVLEPNCQGQETSRTKKSLLFSTMGRVLATILQTVVQASVAAAVVAKDQPPVETPSPHDSTETVAPEIGTD